MASESETVFIEARLKDSVKCDNVDLIGAELETLVKDPDTPHFIGLWKDLTMDENCRYRMVCWSVVLFDSV